MAASSTSSETAGDPDSSEKEYRDDNHHEHAFARICPAINRGEYARAYSYWEADSPILQPYAEFAAGYANTIEVELSTGLVQSDAGAGHVYHLVPVTLHSRLVDGMTQTFVGCYVLHLAQPALQSPPFRPLSIRSADVREVVDDADSAELTNQACAAQGSQAPAVVGRPTARRLSGIGR